MSGFIAAGPAVGGHINTDAFWPSIDLDALRINLRIDSSVSTARLETAAINAAIHVNRELAGWRIRHQAAGIEHLADVASETINDISVQIHLYLRAIQASTAVEITERYRAFDSTNAGSRNAEDLVLNIDDYRRDQRWAIRDFLGRGRTTVELI